MDISKVSINNFLTIKEANLELANRGLLLIQGNNADDTSADSNGAGKSSIADAICWGLYGVTARGVSTDAVVNKTAKKDCFVRLELQDGEKTYRITRYRKHSSLKNQTIVEQIECVGAPVALHKASEKDTQEVINNIVGCSLEVFQAAVYAGQERMPDLPSMTDKQLKLMIEEAAGVEVLAKAYLKARERLTGIDKAMSLLNNSTLNAKLKVENIAENIEVQKAKLEEFETNRKPQAKIELLKAIPIKDELATLKLAVEEGVQDSSAKEELAEINRKLEAIKSEQEELQALNDRIKDLDSEVTRISTTAKAEKARFEKLNNDILNITKKVGQPCGECGKEYCAHDMADATKLAEKARDESKAKLEELIKALKVAMENSKCVTEQAAEFKASMTDTTAMAASQRAMNDVLSKNAATKLKIERLEADLEKLKTAAKFCMEKDNPYTSSVAMLSKDMTKAMEELVELEKKTKEAEDSLEVEQSVVQVFGPAGVRAHILDTVTPYLNDRTAHYLSSLADGNIQAVWNTLSTSAKGEIKEKFNIEVTNTKGAESFAGLSGGEKRKVRLACAMALQDMVASRASKPINIFIADEVDHALDESGLERLMTVLNEKARERGTVLVISHNSLSDWIDDVITVTKEGGYAKVSGATS